jgi:hypothetical protein
MAEPVTKVPAAPTAGSALRAALSGFYYNSWRLVPANAVWGALFLGTGFLALVWPAAALVLWLFVLPLPTAGIFRMATLIARDQPVALSDALDWRAFWKPALAMGFVLGGLTLVLGYNLVVGISSLEPLSWAFATMAGWGLFTGWLVGLALWPLLLDPVRDGMPIDARLRLAATVIFAAPARYLVLAFVLLVVLIASTIMFAALLTVSVAFMALALAAYVLPLADRIEQRRTIVVTD